MTNFEKILEILKDKKALIEVANICDKAYCEGIGQPEWHEPFGEENPEKVAQNVAGLQAVISGIGILAELRPEIHFGKDKEVNVIAVLGEIANELINEKERNMLLRLANCAWGAGQAFRTDKGSLGRLTNMNVFDLLPAEEVEKDSHQIKAAADWLLNKLSE